MASSPRLRFLVPAPADGSWGRDTLSAEVLSGFATALTLMPESVAFSLVVGVSPSTGLYTTALLSLITSLFGGRPAMISGAAGAIAVVTRPMVVEHGHEYLYAAVLLYGILEMCIGALRVGDALRCVPATVVLGFVSGLAILIGRSQISSFARPETWSEAGTFVSLVILGMLVVHTKPGAGAFGKFPGSLAAVLVVTLVSNVLGLQTTTIADETGMLDSHLPSFHIPQSIPWRDWIYVVLPVAVTCAAVGITETVLTLAIVDESTGTEGSLDQEIYAQGLANVLSGLLRGQGGCAMIVPSNLNVSSGGFGRFSGATVAVTIIVAVVVGSPLISRVPLAALTAVLLHTCVLETFAFRIFRRLHQIPRSDAMSLVLVTTVTVVMNLAAGALTGIVVSALSFSWQLASEIVVEVSSLRTSSSQRNFVAMQCSGELFWCSANKFMKAVDAIVIDVRERRPALGCQWSKGKISTESKISTGAIVENVIHPIQKTASCENQLVETSGSAASRTENGWISRSIHACDVVLDFANCRIRDLSGARALRKLAMRYQTRYSLNLVLVNLDPCSSELLLRNSVVVCCEEATASMNSCKIDNNNRPEASSYGAKSHDCSPIRNRYVCLLTSEHHL